MAKALPSPVTDPAVIEAIEAAYGVAVFRAELLRRRRLAGQARPPRQPVRLPEPLAERWPLERRSR